MASATPGRVTLGADGQIEIRGDPFHPRARTRGLCPSAGHPFGCSSWNDRELIGTIHGATSVQLWRTDGTVVDCVLHDIVGTDAKWFASPIARGAEPSHAIALGPGGEEIARLEIPALPR